MIYKKSAPPNTPLSSVKYSFLSPIRVIIRDKNGNHTLMGFGIGEQVSVLEPRVQNLVCNHEKLDEIPLDDGSFIVKYPDSIKYSRVF